jgi:N-acetylglucosaminyldiphosphoundecaprenol N-acetyl-beta-D-mannosaminyltransferase
MSKFLGKPLPQRVPGSDLLPALCSDFQARSEAIRLFLLGGKPGVPERAAEVIQAKWPSASVVGTLSPPYGFENDEEANQVICRQINNSRADVLIVGLGFPKQENWLTQNRPWLRVPVAMGVGATIDFLAGEQKRAPRWIQVINMEWFFRLVTDPKRLAGRYALDAIYFPWICWKQRVKSDG